MRSRMDCAVCLEPCLFNDVIEVHDAQTVYDRFARPCPLFPGDVICTTCNDTVTDMLIPGTLRDAPTYEELL